MELKILLSFMDMDSFNPSETEDTIINEFKVIDKCTFTFYANARTTVKELYEHAIKIINDFDENFKMQNIIHHTDIMWTFCFENYSREVSEIVENPSTKILELLKFLNFGIEIRLMYFVGGIGATWKNKNSIKYFTNSDEEKHKYTPHLHTEYRNKSARYFIESGEKWDGSKYPNKIEKIIQKEILSNRDELLEFWNKTTNGLLPKVFPLGIQRKEIPDEIYNK